MKMTHGDEVTLHQSLSSDSYYFAFTDSRFSTGFAAFDTQHIHSQMHPFHWR